MVLLNCETPKHLLSPHGRSPLAGEDERQPRALVRALDIPRPVGREGVRKLACWLAQRYEVRNPILGSRSWYRPGPSLPKVRPTSTRHFLVSLAGQRQ